MTKVTGWYRDANGVLQKAPGTEVGFDPLTNTRTYSFPVPSKDIEYYTYGDADNLVEGPGGFPIALSFATTTLVIKSALSVYESEV